MTGQHVAVPLLEGVRTSSDGLALRHTATIGRTQCEVVLPQDPLTDDSVFHLAPPASASGRNLGWPRTDWGDVLIIFGLPAVTIRAVGLIPEAVIQPGSEHIAFDHAVAGWKHLLRDWLAVSAKGLTESGGFYQGATLWGSPEYDYELFRQPYQPGNRHDPKPSTPWAWAHALDHASAGDQPPLARALMTTATQAAATADWRVAIIDAATATEVALTTGLTAQLSATLSPHDVERRLASARMLGRRIDLARSLGMTLPARIQDDLVKHRNAVVHEGISVTGSNASAAIATAWEVVDQYEPLAPCCQEPG
jgi:hypothetical protein